MLHSEVDVLDDVLAGQLLVLQTPGDSLHAAGVLDGLGNLDDLRVVAGGLHLRVARNELVVTLLLRLQLVVERGVVHWSS